MLSKRLTVALLSALAGIHTAAAAERLDPALTAQVMEWRRDFHAHPELGNRETRTSEKVAEALRAMGLEVQTGIGKTGVVAMVHGRSARPLLALRADMDALPVTESLDLPFKSTVTTEYRGEKVGVMHACGHDAHIAILLGAAASLVQMKDQLPGSVMLIFQPAEEGPPEGEEGGAELMLKEGLFAKQKPDAIIGLHVWSALNVGQIGVRSGPIMAESDRFKILVEGVQTHGSRPWGGIDPILAAARIVDGLQSIVSRRIDLTAQPAVLSIGAIKGGIRYNIIPDSVEMVGTIRTFDLGMRDQIYADMRQISEHTAQAHGAKATLTIERHCPVNRNDPALTAKLRNSLQMVAGADNLVDMSLVTGAEDFAFFAEQIPSLYFFVGATPVGIDAKTAPSNHSPKFFLDEGALEIGVRATLQTTLDYLGVASPP